MSRVFLKLRLILWKNLIIRKRHWLLTLFEFAIPILLCIAILTLTSLIPKPYISETTVYPARSVDGSTGGLLQLYYAPKSDNIDKLMQDVETKLFPQEFRKYFLFTLGSVIK